MLGKHFFYGMQQFFLSGKVDNLMLLGYFALNLNLGKIHIIPEMIDVIGFLWVVNGA